MNNKDLSILILKLKFQSKLHHLTLHNLKIFQSQNTIITPLYFRFISDPWLTDWQTPTLLPDSRSSQRGPWPLPEPCRPGGGSSYRVRGSPGRLWWWWRHGSPSRRWSHSWWCWGRSWGGQETSCRCCSAATRVSWCRSDLLLDLEVFTWLRTFYLTFFEFPFSTMSEYSRLWMRMDVKLWLNKMAAGSEVCENSCSWRWYRMTGQIGLQTATAQLYNNVL